MFAELYAGNGGRDRLELAAHFLRRIGLHVPHIEVRRPAIEEEEDAGVGVLASLANGVGTEQLRQSQPQQTAAADLDHFAARYVHGVSFAKPQAASLLRRQ